MLRKGIIQFCIFSPAAVPLSFYAIRAHLNPILSPLRWFYISIEFPLITQCTPVSSGPISPYRRVYHAPPPTSPPVVRSIAYAIIWTPCDAGDMMPRSCFSLRIPWDRLERGPIKPPNGRGRRWRDRLTPINHIPPRRSTKIDIQYCRSPMRLLHTYLYIIRYSYRKTCYDTETIYKILGDF